MITTASKVLTVGITIAKLGRIYSMNLRERVLVKGEVTKVSYISDVIDSIVSTVLVTCVHVDIYQEKLWEY